MCPKNFVASGISTCLSVKLIFQLTCLHKIGRNNGFKRETNGLNLTGVLGCLDNSMNTSG
jgi:hypothetical protein